MSKKNLYEGWGWVGWSMCSIMGEVKFWREGAIPI